MDLEKVKLKIAEAKKKRQTQLEVSCQLVIINNQVDDVQLTSFFPFQLSQGLGIAANSSQSNQIGGAKLDRVGLERVSSVSFF